MGGWEWNVIELTMCFFRLTYVLIPVKVDSVGEKDLPMLYCLANLPVVQR
jgi:hypothetical protein